MLISAFLAPVLFYIMNTLIIDKLGADGMYIFTVFFQINSLCLLVLSGSNTAISNIGGILIGEEDYDSFRLLTRRIFRLLMVVMLVESLLIILFPEVLTQMFGATDSPTRHKARTAVLFQGNSLVRRPPSNPPDGDET